MQAIDLVRFALGVGDHVFQGLVADLRDHPLATQSPAGRVITNVRSGHCRCRTTSGAWRGSRSSPMTR